MKGLLGVLVIVTASFFSAQEPVSNRKLKVLQKEEYPDGASLRAVDTVTHDTIRIVSNKEVSHNHASHCKQIKVGKSYQFQLKNAYGGMAQPIANLTMRLKTTVIWRTSDGYKNIPLLAQNMNGLCIIEK